MASYSVGVALFDFVPVLITASGLFLLARGIRHLHAPLAVAAYAAAALVALGGLCKASWKLLVALQQIRIDWLENLLFILMAPGFITLAYCMFHARQRWRGGTSADRTGYSRTRLGLWLAVPLLVAAWLAWAHPQTRLWFFWLLATTTIANAALLFNAIAAARWSGLGWQVIALLIYNFAATLILSGLSRLPEGEATAWIQEGVNFSAQSALALGLWLLSRRMWQFQPVNVET